MAEILRLRRRCLSKVSGACRRTISIYGRQVHGVGFENDPELFIRPRGAAEALTKAKKEGKVRFVGFTGHKDPDVHLPVLNQRGIAPLGMKPIGGHGEPVQKGIFTAEKLLRYAMSLPVATTITGVSEMPILEQNLRIAQGFTPFSETEMQALRAS